MSKDVYGPYLGKDGRFRVIVNGKTVSYPKYLVEQDLKRKLDEDETVHHIDGNPANNDLSNLQIISRVEHGRLHSSPETGIYFNCITKYGEEETRKMMSERGIGNTNGRGNKGKPKSEEHKRKISETLKGHSVSDESKQKMRKPKKRRGCGEIR